MHKILLLFLPSFLLAAQSDIVPRTINFIIFAIIFYYLVARHIKNIYQTRINTISNRLSNIEKALNIAKKNKEETIKKIEKANQDASEIIQLAKEQAKKLDEQILNESAKECEVLAHSYKEQMKFEERKVKLEIVDDIIENLLNSKVDLSQKDLLDIMLKKVS